MADRTGRALGTLDPVIYFVNQSGHILLPPVEIGQGTGTARRLYEERFKHQGYEWKEADTLADVDRLQQRLIDQESKILQSRGERMDAAREAVRRETASNLRQRMQSSDCDPWERDFIALWLETRESKRKEFMQRFAERNQYLWAREMDAKTKIEDRMG